MWLEGRCPPSGTDAALAPFSDLLNRWLGLQGDEPELLIRTRLRGRLEATDLAADDRAVQDLAAVVSPGRPNAGGASQGDRTPESGARRWVAAAATTRPVVLVVEDLHDVDPASRELLEDILPLTDSTATMVVVSMRDPAGAEAGAFVAHARSAYRRRVIDRSLEPLDDDAAAVLLDALAPIGNLDDATRKEILGRAEGSPLYLEELLRFLLEGGGLQRQTDRSLSMTTTAVALPGALEPLLAARVQQLPTEARRTAQVAAAIGREFALDVVAAAAGEDVERSIAVLLRSELVQEVRRLPDVVCRFRHALLHEAVLTTMTPARSREVHGRVLRTLEERLGAEADDHVERLAMYAARGDDPRTAVSYLERAGDRARSIGRDARAMSFFRRARDAAERSDDRDAVVRLEARLTAT
jgi:predicted ATPase